MTADDRQRFAAAMAFLYEKFPRPQHYAGKSEKEAKEMKRREMEDYFLALRSRRIDAVEWAVRRYWETADKPFFPLPKQIFDLTGSAPPPPRRNVPLLEETPASVAKERVREIWRMLDEKYGTSLAERDTAG